jgi:hypothetical protein
MHQKGFANFALIAVIVVLVVIGGYFVWHKKSQEPNFSQVSNTTTSIPIDWKTYTDSQYGFEIKYPSNYILVDYSHKSPEREAGVTIASSTCEIISDSEGSTWPKYCFIYNLLIQKNKILIEGSDVGKTTTQVANYPAEKIEDNNKAIWDGLNQIYVQFKKSDNWFVSYLSYSSENKIIAESMFNQILSTFKFAEPKIKVNILTLSQCLPPSIKLSDVVTAGFKGKDKVTVEQKLAGLQAKCNNGKLVDSSNKEIYFYHLTGCWGNPPENYQDILQKQQEEINVLKEKYTVIEMTCNPSGVPIP